AVIYNDRQGGYIDNVPSTFTRSNSDLGNFYFNIHANGAGVCPNGLPPGPAGFCALPQTSAPQINNYAIAGTNQNPLPHNALRLSALYDFNDDWNVLITESLQNLTVDGLSVEYPTGSDFQQLGDLEVTAFSPTYDRDNFQNTAWTVNGKIADLNLIYTGGYTT